MGNKIWKVGLVGAGGIAPTHIWALSQIPELARLTAVCARHLDRAKKLADPLGAASFTSTQQMIEEGDVDAVIVATPHMWHEEPTMTALKAGKPTIVEKPLAATCAVCDQLIAQAKASGVLLAVCSQREFMEPVQRVRRALQDGTIGRPVSCDVRINGYRSHAYYDHPWKGKMELEGGAAMINQGVHPIAMAINWMGPVKRVFARLANLTHPELDTEDHAEVLVEYASGTLGSFLFSNNQREGFYAGALITDKHGFNVEIQTDELMFVAGPEEEPPPPFVPRVNRWHVKIPGLNDDVPSERAKADEIRAKELSRINAEDKAAFEAIGPPLMGYHKHALKNFFDALNGDDNICVSAEQGLMALEVIEAASRSAEMGAWVDIPVLRRSHKAELEGRKKAITRVS